MAIFTRKNALIGYAVMRFGMPMLRVQTQRLRKAKGKAKGKGRNDSMMAAVFDDSGRLNLPDIPGIDLDIDWETHARRITDDKVAVGASASVIIGLAAGTAAYMLHRQMRDSDDERFDYVPRLR